MLSNVVTQRVALGGRVAAALLVIGTVVTSPNPATAQTTIGNHVWLDADGDGIQDVGESNFANVTVRIYDATTDTLLASTTTNASGNYTFTMGAGTYYLEFVAPTNWMFAAQDQGADDAADSDAATDGVTTTITVDGTAGDNTNDIDCGLIQPTSVGDFVFDDADGDGIQDAGEGGVASVTVTLYDPGGDGAPGGGDDTVVKTTTSNGAGAYLFANLVPGNYFVQVTLPAGYALSDQNQGADDDADSDFDTVTGNSDVFAVAYADVIDNLDAGLYGEVIVRGRVFDDVEADGVRDATDGDLAAAATVDLYDVGDDGAIGGGDDVLTDTAAPTGTFQFANVAPGTYYIEVTPPAGSDFVDQDQGGDDNVDSDVDPDTGYTATFSVSSGDDDVVLDAGLHPFGSITGLAFSDDDEDGIQDAGEDGVNNTLIALYNLGDDGEAGTDDDEFVEFAVTDDNGEYELARVVADDYYISFTAPAGYSFSPQDEGGDDTADSDPDQNTGQTDVLTVVASTELANVDVGLLVDSDDDGTPDSADECPDDPNKVEPGDCGCGDLDTDSDEDGIPDCEDNCPDTANAEQGDFDEDGVGDECDNCAAEANADQADADNDGVGDKCDPVLDTDGSAAGDDSGGGVTLDRDGANGDSGADGTNGTNGEDAAGGDNLPVNCGACAPLGMLTYGLSLVGYAALLTIRRRQR